MIAIKKIKIMRKALIKNFIELAKNLTHFPFFTFNKQQKNISAKYCENEVIIEEMISSLNENRDIFSFQHITSNLVIFHKDGQSLSIIFNNKKNDLEYKIFHSLWNLQNYDYKNSKDLIDYKNLNLETVLNLIKNIFSYFLWINSL